MTWLCLICLVVGSGCGLVVDPDNQRDVEPNGNFLYAAKALVTDTDWVQLEGTIADGQDVDVFDLGPAAAGDVLTVTIDAGWSLLQPTVAIFDASGRVVVVNPVDTIGLQAYTFTEAVYHTSEPIYVAVAALADTTGVGDYTLTVEIDRDGRIPMPTAQTLLLNYEGGTVRLDGIGTYDIDAFSASKVGFRSQQTEALKAAITETVEENFRIFNVTVVTSDDPMPAGDVSVVHFGGYNDDLFGIAESVDSYNRDPADEAIIFTDTFELILYRAPTVELMGTAIGNVASHEAGHLLGLNHVYDADALMDAAHPSSSLIQDQAFSWADLDEDIFPIGTQDAVTLLAEVVGLNPN